MITKFHGLNWRRTYLAFTALVLLAPAVAMPFSAEVAWGAGDFAAAALILGAAWVAVEGVFRFALHRLGRIALTTVVVIATLAVWAHLAVQF